MTQQAYVHSKKVFGGFVNPTQGQDPDQEQENREAHARQIVYRFLQLPHHEKLRIAKELGLWSEQESNRSDIDQWTGVFSRARRLGLVFQLDRMVQQSMRLRAVRS